MTAYLNLSISDEQIIQSFQSTQLKSTLSPLFKKHTKALLGLSYYYISDAEISKDIVMDVYETVLKQIGTKEITNFKAWIMSICRNKCLKHLRDKKVFLELNSFSESFMEIEDPEVYIDERYDILRVSMNQLKEDQRRCLEGFYLHGKSYQEISEDFNLGYKEVKSFIQNGKRNLKNLMMAAS